MFQQLDVDYYNGTPDKQLYHTDLTEAPILRIFGVTEAGNSVCLFVHGFEPYFYIEAPPGWGPDECDILCNELNVRRQISFALFARLSMPQCGCWDAHSSQGTDSFTIAGTIARGMQAEQEYSMVSESLH